MTGPRRLAPAGGAPALAALGLFALLTAAGCRHRGGAWADAPAGVAARTDAQAGDAGVIELLVLGQARPGAESRRLAAGLDEHLRADAPGRAGPALILWLGTDLGRAGPERSRCPEAAASAWREPGLGELAEVLERHAAAGRVDAWGVAGPDGWRCGWTDAPAPGQPFASPGPVFLLRVDAEGHAELASRCADTRCEAQPSAPGDRLEIMVVDASTWHDPSLDDDAADARLRGQLRGLLAALDHDPRPPPRLLALAIPVDSAGVHGYGGRLQRTGFPYLPAPLREALLAGVFVGVVGGLERSLQLSEDLGPAIVRSDRRFPDAPIFQVVSGAAGGSAHVPITSRGDALLPEIESEHLGFARLLFDDAEVDLRLRARVAGRWREAGLRLPLAPVEYGPLRPATRIQPCQDCDPLDAAGDGDAFVPRGRRPR